MPRDNTLTHCPKVGDHFWASRSLSKTLQRHTQLNMIVLTMNDNTTTVARFDFYQMAHEIILTTRGRLNVNRRQLPRAGLWLWLIEIRLSPFEKLIGINRMGLRHLRD